jgi:hypothetical protein
MTLSGWKEIAKHLGCGVRTAQRWQALGLPIQRIGRGIRAPVVADSEKIDRWFANGGRIPVDLARFETAIEASKRLLTEIAAQQGSLRENVSSMRTILNEFRARYSRLRKNSLGGNPRRR